MSLMATLVAIFIGLTFADLMRTFAPRWVYWTLAALSSVVVVAAVLLELA